MRKKTPADALGEQETGRIYTYEGTAIVFSPSTGTKVWKKDFYIFVPALEDLQPGSEEKREQKLKQELTKWARSFQRRKAGRKITLRVTDDKGRERPDLKMVKN